MEDRKRFLETGKLCLFSLIEPRTATVSKQDDQSVRWMNFTLPGDVSPRGQDEFPDPHRSVTCVEGMLDCLGCT